MSISGHILLIYDTFLFDSCSEKWRDIYDPEGLHNSIFFPLTDTQHGFKTIDKSHMMT